MAFRHRIWVLAFVLAVVALGVGGIVLSSLHREHREAERALLSEIAQSQARFIEALAADELAESSDHDPDSAFAEALDQIRVAHAGFEGFGDTGEFTLARLEGDQIVFLLSHRHLDLDSPAPIPFSSPLAEPQHRALSGESGTLVGLDYRGQRVLAAYEPVGIPGQTIGIVAKIDISEVDRQFIRAGLWGGAGGLLLILLGVLVFSMVGQRLVRELAEREERFRVYIENAPDAVFVVNGHSQYIDANEGAARLTGYSVPELLTMSIQDITAPESLEDTRRGFGELQRSGRLSAEFILLRKDGGKAPTSLDVVRLPGDRFLGFCSDITERRRMQAELMEREEMYRSLFDGSKDALMTLSPPSWRFDSCNPAAVAMFGARDEADFISWAPWQYSPERQPDGRGSGEKAREMIGIAMRDGSHDFEWTHSRADGAEFPATVLLTWTEIAGETTLQATVRDITGRKRLESELLHSRDRLRSLTAHLGEVREEERRLLARELHDEVGQELTAMRMDLRSVKGDSPDGPDTFAERLYSMIDLVDDAIERVNRIAHELRSPVLEFLGIEAAIQAHAEEVGERTGVAVVLDLRLGEVERSSERDTALLRIFQEAMLNVSWHARANRVEISFFRSGDSAVLEVRDDGIGITGEQLGDEGSFGLIGMQERAVLVGGKVEIGRRPEGGTLVWAVIPI